MSLGKFIPTRRTPGISTSSLLERIVKGYRKHEFDKKLEKMGRGELMAQGSDYDDNVERATPATASSDRGKLGI
jgi:choline-phosphate cytidylyltransferase